MAIKVNDGFQLGSGVAVDSRLVLTLEEMASMNDAIMPDVYVAICKTDKSLYLYSKENTVNETTGKFRKFEGGDSKIWSGTREEYEAQKETIPEGSLIIITDEEGLADDIEEVTQAEYDAIPAEERKDRTFFVTDGGSDVPESNIVSAWSTTLTDSKAPSEKLVKNDLCGFISNQVLEDVQVDATWVSDNRDVTYTATENCFITGRLATNGTNAYVNILINNRLVQRAGHVSTSGLVLENQLTLPLKKGQTIKFSANITSGSTYMAITALKMI